MEASSHRKGQAITRTESTLLDYFALEDMLIPLHSYDILGHELFHLSNDSYCFSIDIRGYHQPSAFLPGYGFNPLRGSLFKVTSTINHMLQSAVVQHECVVHLLSQFRGGL